MLPLRFIRELQHPKHQRQLITIAPCTGQMDVCCAAGAPVNVDYNPKGRYEQIGDMRVYIAGEENTKGLIPVYDIFGFSNQFLQVCDRLAAMGYVVAAPDIFRGQPWSLEKFPPKPEDNLSGWIQSYSWDEKVKPDVYAVVNRLRSQGVSSFGTIGFCWGAAMSVRAAADGATFRAAALLHPSLFGKEGEWCPAVKGPIAVFSANGDPYETIQEAMKGHQHADQCVYRQYNNMIHGFCGARGKFEDPEVAKCVGEVLGLLQEFFDKNL
eukprot:GHUV01000291.1.p1 GENE.GHUV01000291.1~~GHUV01000291.1.p1  ORF type:complete len:268 (+),score=49.13 GHUV01000291.1:86-889(+)